MALVGSRFAVFTSGSGMVVALDLKKGKKLWSRDDLLPTGDPIPVGDGDVLVRGPDSFSLLSARSGKVAWRERAYDPSAPRAMRTLLGAKGRTIWFLVESADPESNAGRFSAVAYDVRRRKELWRTTLPSAFADPANGLHAELQPGPSVVGSMLLLPNTSMDAKSDNHAYLALNASTGEELWRTTYKQVERNTSSLLRPLSRGLILAGANDTLLGLDLESGKERWQLPVSTFAYFYNTIRGDVLYVTDGQHTMHAVDVRTGKRRWRRETVSPRSLGSVVKAISLSASKDVLFVSSMTEIDALDALDGTPLWRLATVGNSSQPGISGQVSLRRFDGHGGCVGQAA